MHPFKFMLDRDCLIMVKFDQYGLPEKRTKKQVWFLWSVIEI